MEKNIDKILYEIDKVDAKRGKELRQILSNGFNAPIASKIWPKIQKVIAFGAGENYESLVALKHYTGDIRHNHGYYYTEEAILGQACSDDSDIFEKAIISEEFYELISVRDGKVVLLSQAKIGEPYQLVITNNSGLYRYETNHFITIKSKEFSKIYYMVY